MSEEIKQAIIRLKDGRREHSDDCLLCALKDTRIDEALDFLIKVYNSHDDLVAALEGIAEYWNRNENEGAMADALWHIIEVAEVALAKAKPATPDPDGSKKDFVQRACFGGAENPCD